MHKAGRYIGKGTATVWKFDSTATGLTFVFYVMQRRVSILTYFSK